ncbi:hypothetical protein ACWGCC_16215 [Streptomyces nigrescens]
MVEEREEVFEEGVGVLFGNVVAAVGQDGAVELLGHGPEEVSEALALSVSSGDAEDGQGERMALAPVVLGDVVVGGPVVVEAGAQRFGVAGEAFDVEGDR